MPKNKGDKNDGSTKYVAAGNRVIASAMSQANRRPGKAKRGGLSGAGGDGQSNGDEGGYYEKPPKIALSYEDYRKGHQEEETEMSRIEAIAKELSAEYPLLDQPLILSILLDYGTPDNVHNNLDEIRDNLAIFEAALVGNDEEDNGYVGDDFEHYGGGEEAMQAGRRSGSNDLAECSGSERISHNSPAEDNTTRFLPPRTTNRQYSDVQTPKQLGRSDEDRDGGDFTVLPDRMDKLHLLEARDYGFPPAEETDSEKVNLDSSEHANGSPGETSSANSSAPEGGVNEDEFGGEGNLDPAIFLTEMFPTLEQLIIAHTLSECEYDLSAAIESLLSIERIRDVQQRGDWKGDGDTDTDEEMPQPRPSNGRKLWQDSIPEPLSATDSEPDEIQPNGDVTQRPTSGLRRVDSTSSASELGVVPKPLALTLPLYGKIHGHSKSTARKTDETKVPRVREVSGPSDRPTYSSRAGMFSALADHSDSHRGVDSDTESVASSTGKASGSRTSLDGTRPEAFPPISRKATAAPKRAPAEPKLRLDQAEVSKVYSMASWLASLIAQANATEQYFADHLLAKNHRTPSIGLERAFQGLQRGRDDLTQQIQQMSLLVDGDTLADDSELCVQASGGDISVALDLLNAIHQVRSWSPLWVPDSVETVEILPRQGPATRLFPPSPQRATFPKKAQHPQNWKTVSRAAKAKSGPQHPLADFIPAYARGATPQDDTPGSLYGNTLAYDLKSCNHFAAEQRQRRAEAMRLAGHYFKSGMKGPAAGRGKEVASYYAAEARRLEADAMRWELQAARQIVEQNSAGQDRWVIDIHHLTLVEASAVVREQVQAWHETFGLAPLPSKPFRIITGVGKHSASHIAVLRPAIANLLDKDGWKVDKSQKAEGYIIVRGIRGA